MQASADETDATRFKALGYRQTLLPASKGGKSNANGFRFRNGCLRALARTFRGKAFIGGHDWGDPRARGGDIVDAYAEELPGDLEMGIFFDIVAKSEWAIEGLARGTVDRFSFGVQGQGEITCTVHNVPVWSTDECWCWPGEMVTNDDGDQVEAEWEWEGGTGLELSAVNVPAVDGTGIVEHVAFEREIDALLASGILRSPSDQLKILSQLCGRTKAWDRRPATRPMVAVPEGVSRAANPSPTMAPCTEPTASDRSNQMDRTLLCQSLGLPVTATDEQIAEKLAEVKAAAASAEVLKTQLEAASAARTAEQLSAHIEAELARVSAEKTIEAATVASLKKFGLEHGRAAFDVQLAGIEPHLAARPPARAALQSDARAADASAATFEVSGDAFTANQGNPELRPLMQRMGLSVDNVKAHGARTFTVVPNLKELADNTISRGDRMGTGK